MEKFNEKKPMIIFPENKNMIDILDKILKDNNMEESSMDFFNKDTAGIEPRLLILRDAAYALAEKKIPENKLMGFLAKHLETSKEVAQKIIQEINEKLISFIKTIDQEKETAISTKNIEHENKEDKKEAFRKAREELMKKIGAKRIEHEAHSVEQFGKETTEPYKKTPDIADVEDNAKDMAQDRKPIQSSNQPPVAKEPEKKPADPYKEAVE